MISLILKYDKTVLMRIFYLLTILFFAVSCKQDKKQSQKVEHDNTSFVLAFGSCNNQTLQNELFKEIITVKPDVWVWGGDIIYADTEDMGLMQKYYNQVKTDSNYLALVKATDIIGTWDDHDYGVNDGGYEYVKKDSSQQLLLNFLDVPDTDLRRSQQGVYTSKIYKSGIYSINIILLDTRYFRSPLKKDPTGEKRYLPDSTAQKTILGNAQWQWLKDNLTYSKADFNIIMSSIQFLSSEHGFETWGNMPMEVTKMKQLLINSGANNVIFLSGDRHIAEISKAEIKGLRYPLIDITSSGMTHSYTSYSYEPNQYRVSEVVKDKNYGLLKFDLEKKIVKCEIVGLNNEVLINYTQQY